MNVALITLEGGGISTVCYGLAQSLAKNKIPTTIFTEANGKSSVERVNEFLEIKRLHRLNLPPRCVWFQAQNIKFLLNSLKDYTLVHGVSPDASVFFNFYKEKMKKPFIASFHAVPLSNAKHFLATPLSSWNVPEIAHHLLEYPLHDFDIRSCLRGADQITVCSETTLNEFSTAYKDDLDSNKTRVIYNCVNFDEIESVDVSQDPLNNSNPYILFAGRLYWLKGPMFVLKAFELLKNEIPDLNLRIFGTGPEENRMKQFIAKKGLRDRVQICGRIPHKEVIKQIKQSSAVVAPSLHEAQSMFYLEAMACKKPLITFDIPPAKEIIKDGQTGYLAKSFETDDLSKKIRFVLSDLKLSKKVAQNGYNYVQKEHNWKYQIEKYLKMYQTVI